MSVAVALETIRTSITRLKPGHGGFGDPQRQGAWNDKNLDYEIETGVKVVFFSPDFALTWNDKNLDYEIETYVWRNGCLTTRPWNDKNLDYEIETNVNAYSEGCHRSTWNDKNLDYEIETESIYKFHRVLLFYLKR